MTPETNSNAGSWERNRLLGKSFHAIEHLSLESTA